MIIKKRTLTGKKKSVGEIKDGKFTKNILWSKHHFRKANALGIDADIVNKLALNDVSEIIFNDIETGRIFTTDILTFMSKGFVHEFMGFQPQVFLTIEWFDITRPDGEVLQRKKTLPIKEEEQEKLL